METIFDLDNNYYFEITDNYESLNNTAFNIENLKMTSIFKKSQLLIKIDFDKLRKSKYKKILRKLLLFKTLTPKSRIGIKRNSKIFIGYIVNYDKSNDQQNEFISAINAIFYNTRYERYNYIYDKVCYYLDNNFYEKNLCDFKDNKCRNGEASSLVGCCRHFKYKWLGPISRLVLCEHLTENKTCGAECISCKLFTCSYLEKKGIKFKIRNILLLNVFFNPLQKYFIKTMVFTPKGKIIKRLIIL